ncbi:MAG: DUF4185 domain-containing protein [Planctomycetaceae bacterium]|jgi:hypothetical protein|nr:DUF4185 domain-containing protein [Planctomycetaceae bacterium]
MSTKLFLPVTFFLALTISFAFAAEPIAVPANDWTALLDQRDGWTGADGIFSVNLDGMIQSGFEKRPQQQTLFVFSDTILGKVDPETLERRNTKMVNHSFALLCGNVPSSENIRFIHERDGVTTALPLKPADENHWYWLSECTVIHQNLYTFLFRIARDGDGAFGFKHVGVDLARFNLTADGVDFDSVTLTLDNTRHPRIALFRPKTVVAFGSGILENTKQSGSINPDGYIYIYGYRDKDGKSSARSLTAARCLPQEFADPYRWRYYAGNETWSENLQDAVGIVENTGTELSVTPIESGKLRGKFALVYTPGTIGSRIAVRIGESPVGAFGREIIVYEETETKRLGGKTFAYNAKAHPSISKTGELLISYNINSMDSEMRIFKEGGIYYPRFVTVKIDDLVDK